MVGRIEGDDSRLAGNEKRGAKRDLDCVLSSHPQHRFVTPQAEPAANFGGHIGFCEVPEGVDAAVCLRRDRRDDIGVPVPERGHAEAAREVEVLAPLDVDDPATLRLSPDHG